MQMNVPGALVGEADPNSWDFLAHHGPLPNPVGHTFPLLTHDATGKWRLIGTGFYISSDGFFVTSKHVVTDVMEDGQQVLPLAILHLGSENRLFGGQGFLMRPIMQCWLGDSADIVLGVAAHAINNVTGEVLSHWNWSLSWNIPSLHANVSTYAFPNSAIKMTGDSQTISLCPDLYPGTIQDVANFRDSVMIPFPYMQVDFRIHGAASGGPVVGPDGAVIGVNCTENQPDGPAYAAQIRCLQDAFIEDALLMGETVPRRATFAELVATGAVTVRDFAPAAIPFQSGYVVRLNTPITANAPSLSLTMAS